MPRAARAAALSMMCLVGLAARASAQQQLKVSGNPGALRISSAPAAGQAPSTATDATSTYSIKAPSQGTMKVTAQLNAAMPSGLTLTISMPATPGGTSLGPVPLDASARDVLTGIATYNGTVSNAITYSLSATAAAGVVPLQSRTVTLTLTAAP